MDLKSLCVFSLFSPDLFHYSEPVLAPNLQYILVGVPPFNKPPRNVRELALPLQPHWRRRIEVQRLVVSIDIRSVSTPVHHCCAAPALVYSRPVRVGADADVIDPNQFSHMINVIQKHVHGRPFLGLIQ